MRDSGQGSTRVDAGLLVWRCRSDARMFILTGRVPFQTHRVCLDFLLVCLRLLDGRLLLE